MDFSHLAHRNMACEVYVKSNWCTKFIHYSKVSKFMAQNVVKTYQKYLGQYSCVFILEPFWTCHNIKLDNFCWTSASMAEDCCLMTLGDVYLNNFLYRLCISYIKYLAKVHFGLIDGWIPRQHSLYYASASLFQHPSEGHQVLWGWSGGCRRGMRLSCYLEAGNK